MAEERPIGLGDIFEVGAAIDVNYDDGVARMVLAYIVDGHSLDKACKLSEISQWKVRQWRLALPRYEELYQLALRERSYAQFEEILDIAEDATDDATMGANGPIINGKAIRRAELQIQVRKWMMGKMIPKVFGDKSQMELTGADGKDLSPTTIHVSLIPPGNFVSQDAAAAEARQNDDDDQPEV